MQESKFYRTSIELLNNTLGTDKDGLLYAFIVIEYVRIHPSQLPIRAMKRFFTEGSAEDWGRIEKGL